MQNVGILVTSGGSHPPEKWAAASAGQIISIAAEAAGEQAIEGRRLELKMLDILERHHGMVRQNGEKEGLEKYGVERYEHPIDVQDRVNDAFEEILAASKGTIFEKHFMQENVQEHVKEVISKDMTTEVEIERSWHKGGTRAI